MSGGGKGSSSTKPDKWTKEITEELMAYGKEVGKLPYQPWAGVDVAAMTPMQEQGIQQMSDLGKSFGMGGMDNAGSAGMPTTYTDASGNRGYSSFPAFAQNLEQSRGTAAADRYAKFYDLPVDAIYGKGGNYGSVTGDSPADYGATGGKGGGGTAYLPGTGGTGGTGGTTGAKGTAPGSSLFYATQPGGLEALFGGMKK